MTMIKRPFCRSPYNYDTRAASLASGLFCEDETLAQQQFRDECDINTIIRNFGLTGQMPADVRVPLQGDFAEAPDFQSAMNLLLAAEDAFMQYPAELREEFQNDPGKFVEFVSDPKNVERCRELGLARPVAAPRAPIEVKVVPEPTPEQKNE